MNPTITRALSTPQPESPTDSGETHSGTAKRLEQEADHEFLSCNYITVQEAARRLNLHPKRIYRMDRRHGPFPIVKIGWRVWIELTGFEAFLAGKLTAPTALDSELPTQNLSGNEGQQGGTGGPAAAVASAAAPHTTQIWRGPPSQHQPFGGGQRDLLYGWAYRTNWL
jgi:hypothetical protein